MDDHDRGTNPSPLNALIMGFRTTQLVYVAAKLGLADHLAGGPKTASELARLAGAHPRSLYRLMRALASLGIFREGQDGSFEVTPLAAKLRRGTEGSLHGLAILYGDEWLWRAYGRMIDSVRTGETAFPRVHGGASLYEYLENHKDAASVFHAAMSSFSGIETAAILEAYDFTAGATIVDVGGGHGALLAALLNAYPPSQWHCLRSRRRGGRRPHDSRGSRTGGSGAIREWGFLSERPQGR